MTKVFQTAFVFVFSVALITACKNKEVTADVQAFCDCLSKYQHDPEGRSECIEMMRAMKEKYAGDDHALMQILEETESCF